MTNPLIRPEIAALSAYHVPPSRGMVKLDAMENPYLLPPALRQELARVLAEVPINRYPDAGAAELKATLRAAMKIPQASEGVEILLGNGSDEIIQIIALAVAKPGAVMLGLEPSFVMYRVAATYAGMRYVDVALKADFTLDVVATLAAIRAHRPAVTFVAYPNNPTGTLFDAAAVREIIAVAAPGLVVVDEAYFAFADASFLPELAQHRNLVVMRTVSKLGLAGIRLGFVCGSAYWIDEFDKLRMPYNINALTQAVATHLLRHPCALYDQAEALTLARGQLAAELARLPGVKVFPSAANFILFRVANATAVFDGLKQRGILVKNLSKAHALLNDCIRVTVSTPEENQQFISALKACL
jgi:histidinol-phosphate aminotransferase